jgi:hypothetical protein
LKRRGFDRPQIAVISGMVKNNRELFSARDYAKIRKLGAAYLGTEPRRIAQG